MTISSKTQNTGNYHDKITLNGWYPAATQIMDNHLYQFEINYRSCFIYQLLIDLWCIYTQSSRSSDDTIEAGRETTTRLVPVVVVVVLHQRNCKINVKKNAKN